MARLLKWKVSERPSGPYGSFHHWPWPTATYWNTRIAAQVVCKDDYRSNKREHPPLFLWLADNSTGTSWTWRKFKKPLADMKEVKNYAEEMLKKYPHYIPKSP